MEDVLLSTAANNELLENLTATHLAEIVAALPQPEVNTGCILADIGNYLIRSMTMLSQLSIILANGHHVRQYADKGLDFVYRANGFSDLDIIHYMNSKHQALR